MENKTRAEEIKLEIEQLKGQLKELTGECALDLENRRLLKYPGVIGNCAGRAPEIWECTLNVDSLSLLARMMLAPEVKTHANGRMRTTAKKVKELSKEEYRAVCACVDEMAEVLDRHNKKLHPEGIAVGRYVDGMELYKQARRLEIAPETKEVG